MLTKTLLLTALAGLSNPAADLESPSHGANAARVSAAPAAGARIPGWGTLERPQAPTVTARELQSGRPALQVRRKPGWR